MHTLKLDSRKYIGITSQKPIERWNNGKGYCLNEYFWRTIQKYGWDSFKHEILFENLTKEQAALKEKALIKLFQTQNPKYGFNITEGGEHPTMTEKTKEKISISGTKYFINNDELIDLYINKNLSMEQCAQYFGCSYTPVYRRLLKLGITKNIELQKQHSIAKYKITREDFYHLYVELNYSKKEMAEYLGCCTGTVTKIAQRYNIKKGSELTRQNVSKGHIKYDIAKEEVDKLKEQGLSNKEIADHYGCTERTLRDRLNNKKRRKRHE